MTLYDDRNIISIYVTIFFFFINHNLASAAGIDNPKSKLVSSDITNSTSLVANNSSTLSQIADKKHNIDPAEFQVTKILDIPWGNDEAQVGFSDLSALMDGGPSIGPQSFDVDSNGEIFVLDTVKGQVLHYDSQGTYINSISVVKVTPDDIRVRERTIYIFDRGTEKVWTYNFTGKLIATYTLPHSRRFHGIYFDHTGAPIIRLLKKQEEQLSFIWLEKKDTPPIKTNGLPYSKSEIFLMILKDSVLVFDRNNQLLQSITLKFPQVPPASDSYFQLFGMDNAKNIYVRMAYKKSVKDGWNSAILKFNCRGDFLSQVYMDSITSKSQRKNIKSFVNYRLMEDGTIYHMVFTKESLIIYKIYNERRRSL